MYQPDQNRSETNQGMHFHVHQCVCTSPLYNPYRQPMIAPYVPPPVARPYNLSHYQYTSYNMPYNMPVFNPSAITHQVPVTTPAGIQIPEAVVTERRIDNRDISETVPLRSTNDAEDYAAAPNDANTEDFTKFLEQGCIIAEKIAIRNQHRPCFKNIQNLCNRTKNEILKPSHTVSNIHSQGIPWATKDFIYAYVRLINCWHMLKGYLQAKDGTLGNIDRELTNDFKACYTIWESNTKDLSEHMIRIFSNLDNNVSNPTPNQTFVNRTRITRAAVPQNIPVEIPQAIEVNASIVPQVNDETNQFSETTTEPSPREEESDGECRIYMKPGSYNVPKKNNSSDNSSPSIEFFETAKNIQVHYKKLEAKKLTDGCADKDWKNAISATPSLIKKNSTFEEINNFIDDERNSVASSNATPTIDVENVRRWLYHDHFDHQNVGYSISELKMMPERPVTVLQRHECSTNKDSNKKTTKKYFCDLSKPYQDADAMKALVDELIKSEFYKTLNSELMATCEHEEQFDRIVHKVNCNIYKTSALLVQDLKQFISQVQIYFNNNPDVMKELSEFTRIIDNRFPEITFGLDINEIELCSAGNI